MCIRDSNSIDRIESILLEVKDSIEQDFPLLMIDGLFKPTFIMERPLFKPPVKILFQEAEIEEGESDAVTSALYEQFFIDVEMLKENVRSLLIFHLEHNLSLIHI